MKTEKYKNRYGDEYTFTLQEDGNIKWEGSFEYCIFGFDKDPNEITMIDPSGGPYIAINDTLMGMRVKGFKSIESGYLVITEPINKKDDSK